MPVNGCWFPVPDGYHALIDATVAAIDAVQDGRASHAAAAADVFARIAAADFVPPIFGFADPDDRCYRLSVPRQVRTLWWLARSAPPHIKALAAR